MFSRIIIRSSISSPRKPVLPSIARLGSTRRTMATGSKVQLNLGEWPEYYLPDIQEESAKKASELLQENHDNHHIFFNQSGFHNHIAHHLLTVYALRATPDQIQKHYDENKHYQRAPQPLKDSIVQDMSDPKHFQQFLGKEKYYNDYLKYFQKEINDKGWENVLNQYLFSEDERAEAMLVRMYAGFLHPIIHLGFGIEFHQPAIIAEALAQAAVHDGWMQPLLVGAEQKASASSAPSKSVVDLLDQTQATKSLREAADVDGNRIRDGILKTAADTIIDICSQYKIAEASELEMRTAEMTNASAYFTGAAQNPPKLVKMDFFYMHCINSSVFFSAFLKQSWLSDNNKIRLLEWKVRNDIALYASRGCPKLLLNEITDYTPKLSSGWDDIFERVKNYNDDGHGAKLVRALAHGQRICKPYNDSDKFRIKDQDWLKLGHMAIDSVESPAPEWVRSCGFESAWESVGDRPMSLL